MKNKFLAILLSAILLVTMVPFAFASSADSAAEGIVQGANDAVVIINSFSGAFAKTLYSGKDSTINGVQYDRIIFVWALNYTLPSSGHIGQNGSANLTGDEVFVMTHKATITD